MQRKSLPQRLRSAVRYSWRALRPSTVAWRKTEWSELETGTELETSWSFRTVVARVAAAVRPLPAHVQALVKRFQAMQRRPRAAMGKVRSAFYILSSSVVGSRSWSSGHSCWYPCVVCQRRRYQQPAHHLSCRLPRAFLMIASLVRAGSAEVPPAPPRTAVFLTPGGCDCLW